MNKHLYCYWIRLFLLTITLSSIVVYPFCIIKAAPAPPNLFSTGHIAYVNSKSADDYVVKRSRLVYIDFDALKESNTDGASKPSETIKLNLFENVTLTATLDRSELGYQKTKNWIGHISGATYSEVVLAYRNGVLIGDIRVEQNLYQIRYIKDDIHAVQEVDQTAFPPEAEPVSSQLLQAPPIDGAQSSTSDDGSQIDILVVYTAAARAGAGGTTAIQNLISQAESQTNTGYRRSGVIQRIEVVHTAEVSYSESGVEWLTTLERLTYQKDGYMDNVHSLRDTHLADLVVLIVNSCSSVCGIAWVNESLSPTSAFSVVARTSATARYTFAHEMGHNMGCAHDRANASVTGKYSYSYGYRVNGVFSTIMSYTNCSSGCPRINNWSNPEVDYAGYPTGVYYQASNAADNRRTLNNTRVDVANFRAPDSTPPTKVTNVRPDGWTGPYTTDRTPRFEWSAAHDSESDIAGYYVSANDWTPDSNDWWTENTSFTIPDALSDGEYHFAVTSKDNAGNVNPSNTNDRGDAPYYTFIIDTNAPDNPTTVASGCSAQDDVWQRRCTNPDFAWSGADDHGGSGVQDYHIYWGTDPDGSPTVWRSNPSYDPWQIDTSDPVATYYLRIATRDNLGHESDPETVFTLRYDAAAPTANPTLKGGVDTVHSVNVQLEPHAQDEGSGMDSIQLSNDGTSWQTQEYAPTIAWRIPAQNLTWHTILLELEDNAGNHSRYYKCKVCLDLYPPHPSSSSYRLWGAGPTAAGGRLTSTGYQLDQTVGQSSSGTLLTSHSYRLRSGFQGMWPAQPGEEMFISTGCGSSIYLPLVMHNVW